MRPCSGNYPVNRSACHSVWSSHRSGIDARDHHPAPLGRYVDEVFFLGALDKSKVLKAFKPHIFFDDQDAHLEKAVAIVPSGKVGGFVLYSQNFRNFTWH